MTRPVTENVLAWAVGDITYRLKVVRGDGRVPLWVAPRKPAKPPPSAVRKRDRRIGV